ncbi:MAG: hypothetical protein KGN30_05730, partial [Nitrospirota bacterium]|nr:hypothetical protein [Nitrospirota bacterium]
MGIYPYNVPHNEAAFSPDEQYTRQAMTTDELLTTLRPLCPDVDETLLRDFIVRMDRDYFDRFPPDEIARHLCLAARLTPEHPCEVAITEQRDRRFELTLVAYDYFSEFATICGL